MRITNKQWIVLRILWCYLLVHQILVCYTMSSSQIKVPEYTLNNGKTIPAFALGTFLGFNEEGAVKSKDKMMKNVIIKAIDIGYRHFDTAPIYTTESEIGEAVLYCIANNTVTREDLFITTKLWNTHHEKEQVKVALNESLQSLGLDYVDLYLMHWPMGLTDSYKFSDVDFMETWRAMEEVYHLGLAKSIGISNFNKEQIERIVREAEVKPTVLEIEVCLEKKTYIREDEKAFVLYRLVYSDSNSEAHPQLVLEDLIELAQSHGIVVMGYSPFGSLVPRFGAMLPGPRVDNPVFVKIADKYGKTSTQVILRWLVDRKIIPVPKTVNLQRLHENLNIFDFTLTTEEIQEINNFDENKRFTLPSFWQNHPHYPFEKVEQPMSDPFVKE